MTNLKTAANAIKSFFTKENKTEENQESAREMREKARIGKKKKHDHKKRVSDLALRIKPSGIKYQFLRFVSVLMIMSMLVTSNPAAPSIVYASAGEVGQDIRYSFLSNFGSIQNLNSYNPVMGLFFKLTGKKGTRKQQRIAKIEILPGNAAVREGEKIHFSAIAYDSSGNVVQGAEFEWLGWNTEKQASEAPVDVKGGVFEADGPGVYLIGARTKNGAIGTKRIVVREDIEYRAMKEIRRQEREAAEAKSGISTRTQKQQNLRQAVLDEVQRIKANRAPSISNSTRMRKADKAALKQWDDAQKVKRRAARDKRKQKRHQKTSNLQGNTASKDIDSAENIEASSDPKFIILPEDKLADRGADSRKTKKKSNSEITKSKSAVFASGMLTGVNGSNQAYGSLFYPFPESGSGGGGSCPPWQRTCGGGSTTYYSEMEVYVDGDRTTGDFIGLSVCAVQLCSSWDVDIPTLYHDGQPHTLNAYIVNDDGTQVTTASGSPKTFTIASSPEWTNANNETPDDPGVQVGTPANNGTAGAGSGNFGFSAPIVSLAGRNGLDVNLSLNYNSLLWHQDSNSNITYDIDKGSPAPGWDIGFGKVLDMDTTGGAMLESINGTRHSYDGETLVGTPGYSTYYGRTTDGSFVDYIVEKGPSGLISAEAWMPDGSKYTYGSAYDGVLYPTQIKDTNGNYITITYVGNVGPNINTITDTLGRIITFKYDSGNRLLAVKGPGYNGTTQTYMRLHYTQKTLSATFSGLTKAVRDASPYQIDSIYYPVTNTGYWFGDSDSYSSYGMVKKVKMMRGMTSTGTDTSQGTVTAGTMSSQTVYNYPAVASNLTKAPQYTTKTETWDSMDTAAVVTSYSVNNTATPRTTTVTYPNSTKNKSYSYNTTDWKDGIVYKTEFLSPTNQVLSKQEMTWEQGYNNIPRVKQTLSTDEKNQTKKQTFTYGSLYNQVEWSYEYGFSNNLKRKSYTTYENSTTYRGTYSGSRWLSGLHIFSLPLTVEAQDASGVRLSRMNYTYDAATLTTRSGVSNFDTAYNTSSIKRGNVTSTRTYSNAANLTGAIDYFYTYDVLGNKLTSTTNCCQQITTTYDSSMKYAYPVSVRKGLPTGAVDYNQSSVTYDFNTGLPKISTDYNGRVTTAAYDTIGRPTQVTFSTGGKAQFEYFPNTLTAKETARLADNTIVSQTTYVVNGREQTRITKVLTGTAAETATQVKYDNMGRQSEVSRPYPVTGSPTKWTTYTYDIQSRVTQATAPDTSTSKVFYNESTKPSAASSTVGSTVRTQDAWGRERWARSDEFGRLVEVVEPDANGNGSVMALGNMVTSYTYDVSDNLTQINQGVQVRKFKYDDLGRMTHQKLAEQTATINDAGTYVGAGGSGAQWSDAFEYDNRSNLIKRTDARGVKTSFSYLKGGAIDPLNRLHSITFDKTGADTSNGTIHEATDITYTYMTTGDRERINTVTSAGVSTETITYDVEGRTSNYRMVMDGRTGYPLDTSYLYDTANRLKEVRYPTQYGAAGSPRKTVNVTYDQTSRMKDLKVNNVTQMDQLVYNDYGQVTSQRIGGGSSNPLTEQYTFDVDTGLMTNQKVKRGSTSLLDLSYSYNRALSKGSLNGKTGNLTNIIDNLDRNKDRKYEYDTLGRLIKAKGGVAAGGSGVANWTQNYTYDRYGNKLTTTKSGITANSSAIPLDGIPSQSYNNQTNRITDANHEYDHAGNMTRGKSPDGSIQRFEYDEAGRTKVTKTDAGTALETNTYGKSRERLKKVSASGAATYYAWGGSVIAEYGEVSGQSNMSWSKSYVYAGIRLLSTITKDGTSETTEYHHPDRLGTKLVTNTSLNTAKTQNGLPFGAIISSETTASTNQKFTSYDRSDDTGLDYAVNRTYNSGQSRFTQVDPIGMASTSIADPQSMNLFAYTQSNPIDFVDPSGLDPSGAYCDYVGWNEIYTCVPLGGGSGGGRGADRDALVCETSKAGCYGGGGGGIPEEKEEPEECDDSTTEGAEAEAEPEESTPAEIIVWEGTGGLLRSDGEFNVSYFGHVSYVIDGEAYTWEGGDEWADDYNSPQHYEDYRSGLSAGVGYTLDFGTVTVGEGKNRKTLDLNKIFKDALKNAYSGTGGYDGLNNNCGHGFSRAINSINEYLKKTSGRPGKVPKNSSKTPQGHGNFIKYWLGGYIKRTRKIPKRKSGNDKKDKKSKTIR